MKRCPVCNAQYPDDRSFCPADGSPLSAGAFAMLAVQTPDGKVRSFTVAAGERAGIGKAPGNVVELADDVTVSRNHAIVYFEDGAWRVGDAGSRNGVFVNGQRVIDGGWTLRQGDVITVGQSRITFSETGTATGAVDFTTKPEPAQAPPPPAPPPPQPPEPQASWRLEALLPSGELVRVSLGVHAVTVGKGNDNAVRLADPTASRRHAELRLVDDEWWIYDAGSTNGVLVNGVRIGPEGRPVRPGDVVICGQTRLSVVRDGSTGPTPAHHAPTVQEPPPLVPPPPPPSQRFEPPPLVPPPPPPSQPFQPPVAHAPVAEVASSGSFKVGKTGLLTPVTPQMGAAAQPVAGAGMLFDGKYQIEGLIAEGRFGAVYRARRVPGGDMVAIRVLRPDLVRDPLMVERFRRQATVASRIRHPNSVRVFDFGISPEGAVYITEELLSGRTLRDAIVEERGMTLQRVVNIMNQVCGAVHAAHVNGIVLRDVKPDSIFVERVPGGHEFLKVGGYGFAKVDQSMSGGVTMAGQAMMYGTPQYMSPEQWLGKELDSRADVYSLGVILFELLTGAVPYDGLNTQEIAHQHLTAEVPDVSDYRPELDEGIAAVVSRALSKHPQRRQATALLLAAEFQAVTGVGGGVMGGIMKATRLLRPVVVAEAPAPVAPGEYALPSVVAVAEEKGRGPFNPIVLALMAEAFFSKVSAGLAKTAVPLYALLVFGLPISWVMALTLLQNVVPLFLKPVFGSLADKFGKKPIFMISLAVRSLATLLYSVPILPVLFVVSMIRGIADSAKGPSGSAMIADATDEKSIAQAYSWYNTVKSTSGGIGESIAVFILAMLIAFFVGQQTVVTNIAVLEEVNKKGQNVEEFLKDPAAVTADNALPGDEVNPAPRKVLRVEQREMRIGDIPIDDLPKVVELTPLTRTLQSLFIAATVFSLFSLVLVQLFIKDKKKEKDKEKKEKKAQKAVPKGATGMLHMPQQQPNVWAFALLGAFLTAPGYMVTGAFFTVLAVKLEVTPDAFGWIKIISETLVPLIFGPILGWLADKIGTGKVIALRSIANLITSLMFFVTPWFAGTALLALMMGAARGLDEIGKAAFKPTWGAISAKVSSFNLANRSKTMGTLESGPDAADLIFPVLAGVLLQVFSLGPLMAVRAVLALAAEVYGHLLMKKYKI